MKKPLITVVVLAVLISLLPVLPVRARAAGSPAFVISSASVKAGSTVDLTISLENNPGLASIKMAVSFDPHLSLESITYNEAMGGQSLPPETFSSPVTLTWVSPFANYSSDGLFATLRFRVSEAAPSGSLAEVNLTYDPDDVYNFNEDNIDFAIIKGGVTVPALELYSIGTLIVRSKTGSELTAIPAEDFMVTIPITKQADSSEAMVFLASYGTNGQYQGLMYVSLEDVPAGATIIITLPVQNSGGTVRQIKAFVIASFSDYTPLGASSCFPAV